MPFASTVAQNYEQTTYRGEALAQTRGAAREHIGAVAATTLTAKQSGALVLMDAAVGFTIVLPAPVPGMFFDFLQTVTQTSSTQKIITSGAAIFLLGEVFTYTTATASGAGFAFNGSTHVAYASNGTTTGCIIGTRLRCEALSATVWAITGSVVGSGTVLTPAATS